MLSTVSSLSSDFIQAILWEASLQQIYMHELWLYLSLNVASCFTVCSSINFYALCRPPALLYHLLMLLWDHLLNSFITPWAESRYNCLSLAFLSTSLCTETGWWAQSPDTTTLLIIYLAALHQHSSHLRGTPLEWSPQPFRLGLKPA